jgi:hypothetical protein
MDHETDRDRALAGGGGELKVHRHQLAEGVEH